VGIDKGGFSSTVEEGQCQPLHEDEDPEWLCEPLAEWWRYARQALAMVRMSERTLRGRAADEDWNLLNPYGWKPPRNDAGQRTTVAVRVGQWLRLGNIRPEVRWFREGPRPDWQANGLFGALTMQLASVIGQTGVRPL